VGWIVRGEPDLHAVARDHTDAKAAHATRELCGHGLAAVERDLIPTSAENLLDGAGCLDQIVTGQRGSSEAGAS